LAEWQKADTERWDRVTEKVKNYTFELDGQRFNIDEQTPGEIRNAFEIQYRKDIKEEFKDNWWLIFLLKIANRGLYRAETTLEAKDKLITTTTAKDIDNIIQAQTAHVEQFYANAIEANVDAAGTALLDFVTEYEPGTEPYSLTTVILDEQQKIGELRTTQIVNTQTTSMLNGAALGYYYRNHITRYRIQTNDPCPICEELAQDDYTYEQTQEYQISIDKSMQITGYAMESSRKFYADNPWAGMIPVHVNCQCFWTIV
jgi:hypothetical protein